MRVTAQIAKSLVTPQTGRCATLGALPHGRGGDGRVRGWLSVLLGLLCVLAAGLLCSAAPALAEGACPNEAFRQGPSARLPDCRAYEMVSPLYKGGFAAMHIEAVAQDGESVAYFSPGVFAEAPSGLSGGDDDVPSYLATRGPSGWSTSAFMPPAGELSDVESRDVSPTLQSTLAFGKTGPNAEAAAFEGLQGEFFVHEAGAPESEAGWPLAGVPLEALDEQRVGVSYRGADENLCRFLFENNSQAAPLTEKEAGATGQLYEDTRGCEGEPAQLRLVGVSNQEEGIISKSCSVDLGVENYSAGLQSGKLLSSFNAISADGSEIFFTTCMGNDQHDYQLFVRLAGSRTVEVSKPLSEAEGCAAAIPCPGASARASAAFAGASEDGSRVFFMSAAPLTGDTGDTSLNLFMARIGCPAAEAACAPAAREVTALLQVSHDPNLGGVANVQGVLRVAPDGSRAYFIASGDLLSESEQRGLEEAGRPVPSAGADNLYVYDVADPGKVSFIADLCSGHEASGSAVDPACPGAGSDVELWKNGESEAQTAGPEGEYLVFSTYAQLTSDDTDTTRDVYRYDALTGVLQRVSLGEDGADSDGNNDQFNAGITAGHRVTDSVRNQHEMNSRAISEDGSRIVFTSAEPLSSRASNGLVNVYEWHETPDGGGEVSLISGGTAETPVEDVVISPDGNNIFFLTSQGLVRQDTDGEPDVYDARADGGFSEPQAPVGECEGEECHSGLLSAPTPQLLPGSVAQEAGGNLAAVPSVKPAAVKTAKKAKKKKPKKRKRARAKQRKAARGVAKHDSSGRGGR